MEILKLKCLEYHLVSNGKKEILQKRLVDYFTNSSSNNEANNNAESADENLGSRNNSNTEIINTNNTTDNEIENLTLLELRALRSEMSAVKERQQNHDQQLVVIFTFCFFIVCLYKYIFL